MAKKPEPAPEMTFDALAEVLNGSDEPKFTVDDFGPLPQLYTPPVMVEIVRSFAYRMNIGHYEHYDFFCSQKALDCPVEKADEKSQQLWEWCKGEIRKAVQQYKGPREGNKDGP